jgi:hypothetical protein
MAEMSALRSGSEKCAQVKLMSEMKSSAIVRDRIYD